MSAYTHLKCPRWPEPTDHNGGTAITLDDALRSALDGDAILFVGAGLSFLARGPGGKRIPDVDALIDLLLEQSSGTARSTS